MANLLKVKLVRGRSKCTAKQLGTLDGLGLMRRSQRFDTVAELGGEFPPSEQAIGQGARFGLTAEERT